MRKVNKILKILTCIVIMFSSSCAQMPTLFVGSTMQGYQDGMGENVKFGRGNYGTSMTIDKDGNLFVADNENKRIRKVSPDGIVTTFAGTGETKYQDGDLKTASFEQVNDVKFDSNGNLFVADKNRIRKITPEGKVTTFAGSGKYEIINNIKHKIKDGIGLEAGFSSISSIYIDNKDNIYAIDNRDQIRLISPESQVKTYDLESKLSLNEYYSGLTQILVDKDENIYLLIQRNAGNNTYFVIYKISPNGKSIVFSNNNISSPLAMSFDENANIYLLDNDKKSIFKINSEGKEIKEIAKLEIWFPIYFNSMILGAGNSMVIDDKRKILYISDNSIIYKVNL